MPIEASFNFPSDLVATNPAGGDARSTADDHLRGIKNVIKTTFPNITGAVNATQAQLNQVVGVTSNVQTQLNNRPVLSTTGASGANGRWIELSPPTDYTSQASVSFTSLLTSTYDVYEVEFSNVIPITTGQNIWLRMSSNNGSSYNAGSTDYIDEAAATAAQIVVSGFALANTSAGLHGRVRIFRPSSTQFCCVQIDTVAFTGGGVYRRTFSAMRNAAAVVDAVQFLAASGNITGRFALYARAK